MAIIIILIGLASVFGVFWQWNKQKTNKGEK